MQLGLKRGTVQLEPHDKQWEKVAVQTIEKLKSILGKDAIDIQHIGSTAIPAIKAKPIIDIVVGVDDFKRVMLHNEQLPYSCCEMEWNRMEELESKYATDRVAYTNGKQDMIDNILNKVEDIN